MVLVAMRTIRFADLAEEPEVARQAEAIFWESAATRQFAGEAERGAYRDLWFGRYLGHARGEFFLALDEAGDVAGYLAGALISNAPPLPGPDYYALFPAGLIARHPAHLHVNVRAGLRGAGVGAELVRASAEHCRAQGAAGRLSFSAINSPADQRPQLFARLPRRV